MILFKSTAGSQVFVQGLSFCSYWEIFLNLLQDIINSRIMQFDFYLSRVRRDDDGPDILRVDNCTEGKYYDDCCDLESSNDPECVDNQILNWLRYFGISVGVFLILPCLYWIICLFCDGVKTCCKKCYNACCTCCKPQSIVSNENNATRYDTKDPRYRQSVLILDSLQDLSLHVNLHYQHFHLREHQHLRQKVL